MPAKSSSFNSRTPGGVRRYPRSALRLPHHVSIHAPREGCDLHVLRMLVRYSQFQFTHPGRGATKTRHITETYLKFQFTHPGRGATESTDTSVQEVAVSIHAPREGCDQTLTTCVVARLMFQFTHPGRGATPPSVRSVAPCSVSIHAPREGCDSALLLGEGKILSRFNSRTPGGVRPSSVLVALSCWISFNSRTPGGVRRRLTSWLVSLRAVSLHAPREGCDHPSGQ